jgi:hypothetical protein
MSDTSQATTKTKRAQVAAREWIDENGNAVETGKESTAVGFRYINLVAAKAAKPDFNPESDDAPTGAAYEHVFGKVGDPLTIDTLMCAVFGGLTLAGNIANTLNNGEKGDPNANPIPTISERFKEIADGTWTDRTGGGGIRYNKDWLAQAIATAMGKPNETATYLAKMDQKVDPKNGAAVPADTKGAISYGAFAMRVPAVKAEYDKLSGGGAKLEML